MSPKGGVIMNEVAARAFKVFSPTRMNFKTNFESARNNYEDDHS